MVELSYDAHGQRRDPTDWMGPAPSGDVDDANAIVRYGFTGQEQLDGVNLVHMNGRVQDPVVGRMASADPLVSIADNSQGMNRYSYVSNRPLSYRDPSGLSGVAVAGSHLNFIQDGGLRPQVTSGHIQDTWMSTAAAVAWVNYQNWMNSPRMQTARKAWALAGNCHSCGDYTSRASSQIEHEVKSTATAKQQESLDEAYGSLVHGLEIDGQCDANCSNLTAAQRQALYEQVLADLQARGLAPEGLDITLDNRFMIASRGEGNGPDMATAEYFDNYADASEAALNSNKAMWAGVTLGDTVTIYAGAVLSTSLRAYLGTGVGFAYVYLSGSSAMAWTIMHELGHVNGLGYRDDTQADDFAGRQLGYPPGNTWGHPPDGGP